MAKPQSDGKSLNVVHEQKAVKGGELMRVFLRVRYERRNMEAFLSSVGISHERSEVHEQDALYDALEWAEDLRDNTYYSVWYRGPCLLRAPHRRALLCC